MIEEKHNPNYDHERLRPKSWSDLPLDLLISVFERLSFANYQRAKSLCSSWYSASRHSVPKNQIPWLILFPGEEDDDNNNKEKNFSCTLFNPEEKHKLYKTQDLGVEFAKSVCMATYGSWLLMRDPRRYPLYNMHIVNLFTHERIDLPPVELLWKDYERRVASHKRTWYRGLSIRSPVFWIDEKTKDYLVVWGFRDWCVVYFKKGDTSWNQIPQTSDCYHMVYKDHKLYFLSYIEGIFKIFDFSGETPQQTFQSCVRVELFQIGRQLRIPSNSWRIRATQLVVTVTGNVLKVEKWYRGRDRSLSFRVFKVYTSGGYIKKPEQIYSLGNEFMLLDQGITVLANNTDGFIRNSIYFSTSHGKNTDDIFIFNLETQETERPLHTLSDSSPIHFSRVQWFLPSFTHT
ncbi:F-box domain [Arabidopsis thaliana x Arabidopsis arenosa]|uniref:F-box domain n=1 Tax=Arabidopsis thaliana x Arabidopsis arenosa TaxID=1240361 RepID=A0A8T2CIM9_9BRAS|nr:F-box domain [Arabidopsis thaliana x Arabidopsis arenosa]